MPVICRIERERAAEAPEQADADASRGFGAKGVGVIETERGLAVRQERTGGVEVVAASEGDAADVLVGRVVEAQRGHGRQLIRELILETAGDAQARVGERGADACEDGQTRSEEHTSELQSRLHLVCRLLLEKK